MTCLLHTFSFFIFSEGDPDNFLTYFKRATVFLAMGRSKSALPDLERVLELRPDFFQVRQATIIIMLNMPPLTAISHLGVYSIFCDYNWFVINVMLYVKLLLGELGISFSEYACVTH